jgi:hypothetical protein
VGRGYSDLFRCERRAATTTVYWRWDPIGVADSFPTTEYEDDRYTIRVLDSLRQRCDAKLLAEVLREIEREEIGLGGTKTGTELGQALLNWYAESRRCWTAVRHHQT